jgi:CBS domain-containing protein
VAGLTYKVIEVFTSEQARWKGSPLYDAIVRMVAREKSAARCVVSRAVAGCFENGEIASHRVLDLSHNMPLKIEIVLPAPELERMLGEVEKMVPDGIVLVREGELRVHRTTGGLLPRGLLVRDVMATDLVSVGLDAGLREVVAVLVRSEFDGVPVVDRKGRLSGMVTQEELVGKAGMHARPQLLAALWQGTEPGAVSDAELLGAGAEALTVADVMTKEWTTVSADDPLAEAVRLMAARNLKRVPVLDPEGRLVGMLARIDVLRVASAAGSRRQVLKRYGAAVTGSTPVGQAQLLDVPLVSPDTPARDLLDLLDGLGQRVVVVDERHRPLGVISDRDLLSLLDAKSKGRAGDLTAGTLMRTVPTITQATSVEEALDWMVEHRRKRLPVVDDEGTYVGMLSREELLRILAPETEKD